MHLERQSGFQKRPVANAKLQTETYDLRMGRIFAKVLPHDESLLGPRDSVVLLLKPLFRI